MYYGLFDFQLEGFKGGYANESLVDLVNESASRIIELSKGDNKPIDIDTHPIDVLSDYGYTIKRIKKEGYDKIMASDTLFLSEVVRGVDFIEDKPFDFDNMFDWRGQYLEEADNYGLFNMNDYKVIKQIYNFLDHAYWEYRDMDEETFKLIENELNIKKEVHLKELSDLMNSFEKLVLLHKSKINSNLK